MPSEQSNPRSTRVRYPEDWSNDAKEIWRWVVETYDLNKAELSAVKELCRAYTRLDWLNSELEGAPAMVESRTGPIANPLLCEVRLTAALAAKLYASLRLPEVSPIRTPVSTPAKSVRPRQHSGARPAGKYGSNPIPDLRVVGN